MAVHTFRTKPGTGRPDPRDLIDLCDACVDETGNRKRLFAERWLFSARGHCGVCDGCDDPICRVEGCPNHKSEVI